MISHGARRVIKAGLHVRARQCGIFVQHVFHRVAIPQNFLLDPTGKIVAKNLNGEDLQKKLASLIPQ